MFCSSPSVRTILLIVLFTVGATNVQSAASDSTQQELLAGVVKSLGSVQSVEADFIQKRQIKLFTDVLVSRGKLFYKKPDCLRWEVTQPQNSVLIFSSGWVGQFTLSKNSLIFSKSESSIMMQKMGKQILNWMNGNFKLDDDVFLNAITGKNLLQITLTPENAKMSKYIERIELHMKRDQRYLERIKIVESESDFIEILFNKVKLNKELDPKIFNTENPQIINP